MAIYHLTATTGTREGGQSAGAKSDYIHRAGQYDRDDLVYAASGNMPMWAAEPGAYWQAADVYERINGRLYKEIEGALPRELSLDQQRKLVEAFVSAVVDLERLPYSFALHSGEGTNPHFHLLISERMNDGIPRSAGQWFKRYNGKDKAKGGARKTDSLKPQAWLEQTRELWADLANAALERAGHATRIDHRTLEAQGLERIPQIHLGPAVAAMEKKGIRTDWGDWNREIAKANAEIAALQAQRAALDLEWFEAWDDAEAVKKDQATKDAQDIKRVGDWAGVPLGGGFPSYEELSDDLRIEMRYGVEMLVTAGMVMINTGQPGSDRQLAAALYRQCKEQAVSHGWAGIEFFGLSSEARAHIERMAAEDGWGARIEFREDAPADRIDLDAAMMRPQSKTDHIDLDEAMMMHLQGQNPGP